MRIPTCQKCGRYLSDDRSHACPVGQERRGGVVAGERYGQLIAIRLVGYNKDSRPLWECLCDCGVTAVRLAKLLRNGMTRSCGCAAKNNRQTHGKTDSAIYRCWRNMLNRCEYPGTKSFADYGARGISVCEQWHNFEIFYADMGDPPFAGATIDRIDSSGNYEPSNCRWATRAVQGVNRRNVLWITFQGETKRLAEWSRITGIKEGTLRSRIKKSGMKPEVALTKGVRRCA